MQYKVCTVCKEDKSFNDFNKNALKVDGLRSECKSCRSERYKDKRTAKTWSSKYHAEKLHMSSYRHLCETGYTGSYKEMLETYEHFYKIQLGKCAICGDRPPKLKLDHSHNTGQIRGLLCNGCNWALGCLNDSPLLAEAIVKYLNGISLDPKEHRVGAALVGEPAQAERNGRAKTEPRL